MPCWPLMRKLRGRLGSGIIYTTKERNEYPSGNRQLNAGHIDAAQEQQKFRLKPKGAFYSPSAAQVSRKPGCISTVVGLVARIGKQPSTAASLFLNEAQDNAEFGRLDR